MVKRLGILLTVLLSLSAMAQEVLSPVQWVPVRPVAIPKTQSAAVNLPFFDDFATGSLNPALWSQEGGAQVMPDVSPLAPTVGVLTLDAIDAAGKLYEQASTSLFPADTATSLPLRLDSLTPSDLVLFSFYYLPGGGYGNMWERVGEAPDSQDSLFLDFYRAVDSTWVNVWNCSGVSVDTLVARTGISWQYVAVRIADSAFFDSTFRFRFRNYASLESTPKAGKAGNCDYWHIDYVRLYTEDTAVISSLTGPFVRDIAFAAPAKSFLQEYRAMPYRQFTAADMAAATEVKITNRYLSQLASHYAYSVQDSNGNELYMYDGGYENAPAYYTDNGTYQMSPAHATPPINYCFPTMTAPEIFTIVHTVREGAIGDDYGQNDTIRYRQEFANYYAYDDGTAENGYSLTSPSSPLSLAYRFDLNVEDTLTAVDLYFNSTLNDANAAIPFYLMLWSEGSDGKPSEVLYRDQERRRATTGGYHRYMLETPTVVSGNVFVGFEQVGNDFINLGFDRSLNTSSRIYYITDSVWCQSFLSGSLMIRPYFGSAATLGVERQTIEPVEWSVYPNPASDRVTFSGEVAVIELYDMQGRRAAVSRQQVVEVGHCPEGLYLVRVITPEGQQHCSKLIIKH